MKYEIRLKNDMYGYERDHTMTVEADSEQQAIAIGRNFDCYADISVVREVASMDFEQIDNLVVTELKAVARNLADEALLGNQNSLNTLDSVLGVIQYYSTNAQYAEFEDSLPDELFSNCNTLMVDGENTTGVYVDPNAPLGINLIRLGYKAYMGMASLGFISIEDLLNYAEIGQKQKV